MIYRIWNSNEPYIIAEVSQNHDGSLGQAHAFIDAVAETGADAIKFQTHIAEEESSAYEPFREKFSYEDATRYDYWKRMEFTIEQWKGLYDHAINVGLDFLSSPFSQKALDILENIGVPAWKFGSGEVFNDSLLKAAIDTGKPILLSTGLSTYKDIDEQVEKIEKNGNRFLLFQCVTAYPSTADIIDISLINKLKDRYGCKVGISDHSATIYPSLSAMTLGASAVEVHVTMNHHMFGPDVKASVNLEQLKQIVEGAKFISRMKNVSVDMEIRDSEREILKDMFSKSLFLARNVMKGEVVTEEILKAKKPNIGIDARELRAVVGRILNKNLKKNEPLKWEDIC